MLPFDFDSTMESFTSIQPVTYSEATATVTDGQTTWSTEVNKGTLKCIVFMATKLVQMLVREGHALDGVIAVITETPLYCTDAVSGQNKQSYVTYMGVKYRVNTIGLQLANSKYLSYACTRSML